MKKTFYLIILISFSRQVLGQTNLVPNGSFETYTSCPSGSGQLFKAPPWYGTNNSSEYLNGCGLSGTNVPYTAYGFQTARSGNAYSGEYFMNGYGNDYREYIQTPLTSTLITGQCYLVKFYVNCVNAVINYASNNFAAHISTGGYTTNFTGFPATSFTPQIYLVNNPIVTDTLRWTEIGGIYTALGGENFITIGNFKNDANTDTIRTNNGIINAAYYFIDDVSVQQITTPTWQLKDTMILSGDSVLIGPLYSGITCNWFNMLGNPIGSGSAFWVKPTTTTSYILQQTFCNTTFSDTMTVYVSALGINESNYQKNYFTVFPQPANDILKVKFNNQIANESTFQILDVLGRPMNYSKTKSNDYLELDVHEIPNGIYFLRGDQNILRKIIINR